MRCFNLRAHDHSFTGTALVTNFLTSFTTIKIKKFFLNAVINTVT